GEGESREWLPGRPGWWNVNGANTSLPLSVFEQVGGFPDYLQGYGGEDVALGYLLVRAGLELRSLPGAAVVHQGPATGRGGDPERWREAGANAARLARHHPATAYRLGVTPWQLRLKQLLV